MISRLLDLLIKFDEMGFEPTTVCEDAEEYAKQWKDQVLEEVKALESENTKLRKELEQANGVLDTVCKKLRLMAGKEKLEDVKPNAEGQAKDRRTRAEIDADARTLWERHFAPLHARAQAIADANVRRAESDRDYAAVHKEIRGLEPAIARAKHDGDRRTAEQLTRRHASLKVLQARILSRLGLTAADLQPKYKCTVCEDTGFRKSDGRMCNCWQLPKSGHEGEKAN